MLKPMSRIHCLCCSISSLHFSSPCSMMHASRALFVSGQAQHALHFGFALAASSKAPVAATDGTTEVNELPMLVFFTRTGRQSIRSTVLCFRSERAPRSFVWAVRLRFRSRICPESSVVDDLLYGCTGDSGMVREFHNASRK
uniref:Putative secreted protein n=1 Tax=Anopheles marajoara TaxID=58244 RepID=A0A2M4C6J6_9DIPT